MDESLNLRNNEYRQAVGHLVRDRKGAMRSKPKGAKCRNPIGRGPLLALVDEVRRLRRVALGLKT